MLPLAQSGSHVLTLAIPLAVAMLAPQFAHRKLCATKPASAHVIVTDDGRTEEELTCV